MGPCLNHFVDIRKALLFIQPFHRMLVRIWTPIHLLFLHYLPTLVSTCGTILSLPRSLGVAKQNCRPSAHFMPPQPLTGVHKEKGP